MKPAQRHGRAPRPKRVGQSESFRIRGDRLETATKSKPSAAIESAAFSGSSSYSR